MPRDSGDRAKARVGVTLEALGQIRQVCDDKRGSWRYCTAQWLKTRRRIGWKVRTERSLARRQTELKWINGRRGWRA